MNVTFLRTRMKELGFGNEDLAIKSGVPLGTLNKILAGTSSSPQLNTLEALATALDCSIEDFSDRSRKSQLNKDVQEKVSEISELMTQLSQDDLSLAIEILRLFAGRSRR